jgi:hypothetical protein
MRAQRMYEWHCDNRWSRYEWSECRLDYTQLRWRTVCFRFSWWAQVSFVLFTAVPLPHLSAYDSQCRRLAESHCAGLPLSSGSGSAQDIHLTPRWSPSCWCNVILSKDARCICFFLSSPKSDLSEAYTRAAITVGQRKAVRRPGYLARRGKGMATSVV